MKVTVHGAAADAVARNVPTLLDDHVATRLAGRDAQLWGPEAVEESAKRLGWIDLPLTSRPLVARIEALRAELAADGVDRVVLCGMGGSTVETDSQRRAFEETFEAAGIDAATRVVVVTDPGSPLKEASDAAGYRAVFEADPEVGGRYSALTAFGLVPSGLTGVDVSGLLDEAAAAMAELAADDAANPALVLGAALAGTEPRRDKIVIVDEGSGITGLGDWAEQLIAESTGKEGTGILPVVVDGTDAPEVGRPADDVLVARLLPAETGSAVGSGDDDATEVTVSGTLGAHPLLWETATVVAGRLLGINPFDQPDVESAKTATRGLLDAQPSPELPAFTDDGIEVRGTPGLLDGVKTVSGAIDALLGRLDHASGYLAVMAYLDREANASLADVRNALARRAGRPVTFGWGPRFLHSTGQFHKGGPATGVYLQVTSEPGQDLVIPGRPFTFGTLIAAQAAGDAGVLADHGRPVLRLHLTRGDQDVPAVARLLAGST